MNERNIYSLRIKPQNVEILKAIYLLSSQGGAVVSEIKVGLEDRTTLYRHINPNISY